MRNFCKSRRMLQNEFLIAKIGFDTDLEREVRVDGRGAGEGRQDARREQHAVLERAEGDDGLLREDAHPHDDVAEEANRRQQDTDLWPVNQAFMGI